MKIIINESQKYLLTEGQTDKVIKRYIQQGAANIFQPYLNIPVSEIDNQEVINILKQMYSRPYEICLEKNETLTHCFRYGLYRYFDINVHSQTDIGPIEYIRGIARIACIELGLFSNQQVGELSKFKQNVLFLHRNPQLVPTQFNNDLNGMDDYDFYRTVNKFRLQFINQNRANHIGIENNSDYEIVQINSFEEAQKYSQYTSWCVTHSKDNYDGYRPYGERFYFCLQKGFESIPQEATEGCPLDTYGLSMISVLIDMDGEPVLITTRWNHDHNGENNPNLTTIAQFEELTKIDWYSSFAPYSPEELKKMGITPFYEIQDKLDEGISPYKMFKTIVDISDGLKKVRVNHKWNLLTSSNQLLYHKWFDDIQDFIEGFASVRLNDKFNFINQGGQLISNTWFDYVSNFDGGFALVNLNDKYNLINQEGQLISDTWFYDVDDFYEGFARVTLNRKWNWIDTNGNLLWNKPIKEWFDHTYSFHEGFARVKLNGKFNFINQGGQLLSDTWFDYVDRFDKGFAPVINDEFYYIDTEGNLYDSEKHLIDAHSLSMAESKARSPKKIYINEDKISLLKENLNDDLISFIMDKAMTKQTSLSYCKALPQQSGIPYEYDILQHRFTEVKNNLLQFGDIQSTDEKYLITVLSRLIVRCQELERPIQPLLMNKLHNMMVDMFNLPEESVLFKCKLVDRLEDAEIRLMPEGKHEEEYDFSKLMDFELKSHIMKRRFINALIQGGSYSLGTQFELYDIDNEELVELYKRIIAINDYILFTVKEKTTDKNPKQGAYVKVMIGKEGEKTNIEAQGIIFPLLVIETIRGFLELLASHGLPKDNEAAREVIKHSDFLLAEPWDMRMGVSLWNKITDKISDMNVIPYYFTNICRLHNKEFNETVRNILLGNNEGRTEKGKLLNRSENQMEYQAFLDKMSKKNSQVSTIMDGNMSLEDLDKIELSEDHRQLSLPFDGNIYKYNYEYFVDYLHKIGKEGTLPPNEDKYFDINNELYDITNDYFIHAADNSAELFDIIADYLRDLVDDDAQAEYEQQEEYADINRLLINTASEMESDKYYDEDGNYTDEFYADVYNATLEKCNEQDLDSQNDKDFLIQLFHDWERGEELDPYYEVDSEVQDNYDRDKTIRDLIEDCENYNTSPSEVFDELSSVLDTRDYNTFCNYIEEQVQYTFVDNCRPDFDENGLMYIERAIDLKDLLNKPTEFKQSLYHKSVQNYPNGIGNCWAYEKGSGRAYCSEGGDTILLVGKVDPHNVDWSESCRLHYVFGEDEARIKHNSPIEIDEILTDDDKHISLPNPMVVNSGNDY